MNNEVGCLVYRANIVVLCKAKLQPPLSTSGNYVYRVRAADADAHGLLGLPALIDLMQDAAWRNAAHLDASVEQLHAVGLTWVLSRLWLEMDACPPMGQELSVETWPAGQDRSLVYRDFRFWDDRGRPLGRATTTWLVLDLVRRRPHRIPAGWQGRVQPPAGKQPLPRFTAKWKAPTVAAESLLQRVAWPHLDLNQHVNQTHYVRWALAALPAPLHREARCSRLEVILRQEVLLGDALHLTALPEGADRFSHAIHRQGDGQLMAQLRSYWQPTGLDRRPTNPLLSGT